jgi:VWFA-related protein
MKRLMALALTWSIGAQEPQFDAQSRLVMIPVTVADKKGRFVDGLEPSDFVVLDNGRRQDAIVDTIATGVAPIALVVAVQSSGISYAALEKIQKIGPMIQPLITGERGHAAVIAFDEDVTLLQDFTGDPDAITRAFHRLRPGDEKSARMLDAVDQSVRRLSERRNVRRVLLLISESRDRGSEDEFDPVAVRAQAAGVAIYAATYSAFKTAFTTKPSNRNDGVDRPPLPSREPESPPGRERVPIAPPEQRLDILGGISELKRLGKPNTTQELAKKTGGAIFAFTRQRGLEDAIEKLGGELHAQYVLSFVPEDRSPGYHPLEVRIRREGDYRIRARPGYWAVAP